MDEEHPPTKTSVRLGKQNTKGCAGKQQRTDTTAHNLVRFGHDQTRMTEAQRTTSAGGGQDAEHLVH